MPVLLMTVSASSALSPAAARTRDAAPPCGGRAGQDQERQASGAVTGERDGGETMFPPAARASPGAR